MKTWLWMLVFLLVGQEVSWAASLRPARSSLNRQYQAAQDHGYTFLKKPADVARFVELGYLVRVREGRHHELHDVSFPYARPEVKLFIERLATQYYEACSEELVVTSLTRPHSRQPWNSSRLSVHPTGMALDLRRSGSRSCRSWLERALVGLERNGVLEASRERNPPHYHIALFPDQYLRYLIKRGVQPPVASRYEVASGDTLWKIARQHGLSVAELRRLNGLSGTTLHPGQVLRVPPGTAR